MASGEFILKLVLVGRTHTRNRLTGDQSVTDWEPMSHACITWRYAGLAASKALSQGYTVVQMSQEGGRRERRGR